MRLELDVAKFDLPSGFLLSVLVPIFNERETLSRIVEQVKQTGIPLEIILVDDGSADGSTELVRAYASDPAIQVVLHEANLGKGAAIRSGIGLANGQVLVVQDADLEYDPIDFWELLRPIIQNQADAVYGSRFSGGETKSNWLHRLGNQFLTFCSNYRTRLQLTDVETCYKMIKMDVLRRIDLFENGFGFEIEITAKLQKIKGIRVVEVPISYSPRNYQEGKKIGFVDVLRALWCIFRY